MNSLLTIFFLFFFGIGFVSTPVFDPPKANPYNDSTSDSFNDAPESSSATAPLEFPRSPSAKPDSFLEFPRSPAAKPDFYKPEKLKALAQCLKEKGVKFYGAHWCPHCKDQKEVFGEAAKDLHYIECYTDGSETNLSKVCSDAKIESFPTWIFSNGEKASGILQPEILAKKAGCSL